ncbi:MAG: hypothetical protein ACYTHN_07675 [Planctomycetota bacterium]
MLIDTYSPLAKKPKPAFRILVVSCLLAPATGPGDILLSSKRANRE